MKSFICLLLIFISNSYGEIPPLKKIINSNLEPSYLAFGNGLDFTLDGHKKWSIFNKAMYEGQINLHLAGFENLNYKGWDFMTKVTGKFQVRQTTEKSAPVKTPGYLPRVTFFFWKNKEVREKKPNYWSLRVSHHSNGQAGDFYNPDGTINTQTGNFSTNYLELSSYNLLGLKELSDWTRWTWTQLSLVWHPGFNRDKNLDGQYEDLKLSLAFRTTPFNPWWLFKTQFKVYAKLSYTISGLDYRVAPIDRSLEDNIDVVDVAPIPAQWYDRLHFEARALFNLPQYFKNINFFVKYDVGHDYYNIQFRNRFHKIQVGLIGNPFGLWDSRQSPSD